jgi:hypothetical protein
MTQEQIEYGERYAYDDITEYEHLVGYKMSDVFKAGWGMARMKNKDFGFFKPDETNESTEAP